VTRSPTTVKHGRLRERYPYLFANQGGETVRAALHVGDYVVHAGEGTLLAASSARAWRTSRRRSRTARSPSRCSVSRSSPSPRSSVEGRYSGLYRLGHVSGAWLADELSLKGAITRIHQAATSYS
jgi:hypothetical protein